MTRERVRDGGWSRVDMTSGKKRWSESGIRLTRNSKMTKQSDTCIYIRVWRAQKGS